MPDDGRPRRPDQPYVVEAAPARAGGGSRLRLAAFAVVIAGVVGLSGWGLLTAPGTAPTPRLDPSAAVASGTPDESIAPGASPGQTFPALAEDGSGISQLGVDSDEDAFAVLAHVGGWDDCPMWRGIGDGGIVTAQAVTAAMAGAAAKDGMVVVRDTLGTDQRVWIGTDEADAVRGFGGAALVRTAADAAWTGIPDSGSWRAVRLEATGIPGSDRRAWQIRAEAYPAPYCAYQGTGGPPATVEPVAGSVDGLQRLMALSGWQRCRTWSRLETGLAPDLVALDQRASDAGLGAGVSGFVTIPVPGGGVLRTEPVWVGDDPARAGTAHGSQLVVVQYVDGSVTGTDGIPAGRIARAWMAVSIGPTGDEPLAVAFDLVRTPGGRTAWLPTLNAAGITGDCSPGAGGTTVEGVDGPVATPGPGRGTVELLRGGDPAQLLAERLGWTGCRMNQLLLYPPQVDAAALDRAAEASGIERGWLIVSGAADRLWLGDDIVELARALDRTVVAIHEGTPYVDIADETRANEWRVISTPAGRTVWILSGSSTWPDGPCGGGDGPSPSPSPTSASSAATAAPPPGIRSLTCWTDREPCIAAAVAAQAVIPDAFDGSDVSVALATGCEPEVRCAWTFPTADVIVTSVGPNGKPSDVRAFSIASRRLSGTGAELAPADITADMLRNASRPALALPVVSAAETAATGCPAAGIEGVLRGSPWDPRVAWVGLNTVRWPQGFRAAFVPQLVLLGPAGERYPYGATVQVSGTAGAPGAGPGFAGCRVTLVASAAPLPSAP